MKCDNLCPLFRQNLLFVIKFIFDKLERLIYFEHLWKSPFRIFSTNRGVLKEEKLYLYLHPIIYPQNCRKNTRICRNVPASVEKIVLSHPYLSKVTPRFVENSPTSVEDLPVFVESIQHYFLFISTLCASIFLFYILFILSLIIYP